MKTITSDLLDLFNNERQALAADLLTLTTLTGTIYRYTNADVDLTWGGNTYISTDILFERGEIRCVIGVEVDMLSFDVYATPSNTIGGVAFMQALAGGALDGARVSVQRAYARSWTTGIVGVLQSFTGRVADIEGGRTKATVSVKSDTELLNIKMPRNLYQPACVHTLFDAGCTLIKSSFGIDENVLTGSTNSVIVSGSSAATDYWALGTITFTSGVNNGISRTVKAFSAGVFTLSYPLPFVPSFGDHFTAYPGCDKLQSTCSGKFNNLANFRGFPFVPVPETSV